MSLDPKLSKQGKLALASPALHPRMVELLAQVAEVSVQKGYDPLNWLYKNSPVTVSYCLNASDRHKLKAKLGIDFNNEELKPDGTPCTVTPMHLAQSAYNDLMAALLILEKGELADDRVFKDGKLKADIVDKSEYDQYSQDSFKINTCNQSSDPNITSYQSDPNSPFFYRGGSLNNE